MKSKSDLLKLSQLLSPEGLWHEFLAVYKVVLSVSFVFAVVFFGYNKANVRTTYEATADIMPKMNRGASSMESFLSQLGSTSGSQLFGGLGNANVEIQQFFRILQTRYVALKALQINNFESRISDSSDPKNPDEREAALVAKLQNSIIVKADSNLINIRFRAADPVTAVEGVKSYLAALQSFLNENIITQTKNAELFIRERLVELAKSQDTTELKLMALKTGKRGPDHPERSIQSEISRTEREFTRVTQMLDLLNKQYELAQIESKRTDPMFIVVDPPYKPLKPLGASSRKQAIAGALIGFFISFLFMIFYRRQLS